jgi:hypothetical protein
MNIMELKRSILYFYSLFFSIIPAAKEINEKTRPKGGITDAAGTTLAQPDFYIICCAHNPTNN